ncbi:hypothetical protein [Comamonas sp. MYb396]|uniref:hypothetical protein n=1 Tax=Comamonas sp. MYb396 TaxID=2745302 RepID=UPI0030B00D67
MNASDKSVPAVVALDLQDEKGRSLVEIRHFDEREINFEGQGQKLDSKSVSQFNHWLGLVPSSASAAAGHSKQLMTCSFEYSKLIQAKDGSGAIGAVYKEGSTQLGAQARFQEAKSLQSVVNTGLIVNIASQVLAQKHLADINERLEAIERQVKGLQEHLERSRFAKIQTFQEHLRRVGNLLEQGEDVLPSTFQILGQKAQDVRAEVIHLRHDLEDAHKQVRDFDPSSWFGSNDLRLELQEKIKRVNHLQREYLLGMQCLLVANLILFIKHDGNKEFLVAGNQYRVELENEQGLLNQWEATKRHVAVHLSKMKPVFELKKSTQANAQMVESTLEKVQFFIAQDAEQVFQLQQRLEDAQTPCVLLEVDGGVVVRGNYLS